MEDPKSVDLSFEEGGEPDRLIMPGGYGGNCCSSCSGATWTWCSGD